MNIFSTAILIKVISLMKNPSSFILDRYFRDESFSETEEIAFDIVTGNKKMAPFVSPVVAGQPVKEQGSKTKTIKPAYLKPKTALSPTGSLKRAVGEKVGGAISPAKRQQARLNNTLADHLNQIMRRFEWMAVQALRLGAVTIKGDNYPLTHVDFGRDPALTIVKTAGTKWGDPGISILDDLQDWSLLVQSKSQHAAIDLLMPPEVWKVVKKDPEIKERLDTRNLNNNLLTTDSVAQVGGKFQGSVDGFNFFTYTESYTDEEGVEHDMIPADEIIFTSQGVGGIRAFGAIMDEKAGLQSMAYFPKSWVPEDPAIRQVMTQSAPLMVPANVNASMSAKVL